MEESLNDVFGLRQGANSQKEMPPQLPQHARTDRSVEKTLSVLATVVLVIGIIAAVVCLFIASFCIFGDSYSRTIAYTLFSSAVGAIFVSLLWWGILRVLANISNTLKDIKEKMQG